MNLQQLLRNNPVMPVAISLAAGIVIGDRWGDAVPRWVWAADMVLVIVALSAIRMKPWMYGAAIHLATLFFGIWSTASYEEQRQIECPDGIVAYEAIVASTPQAKEKVWTCDLWVMSWGKPQKVKASFLHPIGSRAAALPHVGYGIIVRSRIEPPSAQVRVSHFDYGRWLSVHGYMGTALVGSDAWGLHWVSLSGLSLMDKAQLAVLKFRESLVRRYGELGLEDQQLALLCAMTLGDKSMITSEVKQDYSISGGSHILALSGLHLGLLYAVLVFTIRHIASFVGRWRRQESRNRWGQVWVQAATLLAIWAYSILVGLPASVVRAATMISVYAIVSILNRDKLSLNTLAIAAVVMLVVNPLSLWDAGFQMSFLAVLGIVMFYPRRRLGWICGVVVVSLSAQIMVAPLILYYFGRFSCYFLLTNFVVIPCATLLLYGAFAMWAFTPFMSVQALLAKGLSVVATWMNGGVSWIASLPGSSIEDAYITDVQAVAIYVLIFCVYRIISITLHPKK